MRTGLGVRRFPAAASPLPRGGRLAPFVLVSLLLHAVLLMFMRMPAPSVSRIRPPPLTVQFAAPAPEPKAAPVPPPHRVARRSTAGFRRPAPAATFVAPPAPEAAPAVAVRDPFETQQLLQSTREVVRDEARKIERRIAAEEERRRRTPAGMMAQQLQQRSKEIRLANGMLKIRTAAGEVCFQPVPIFARDMPGLYGIPVTCP